MSFLWTITKFVLILSIGLPIFLFGIYVIFGFVILVFGSIIDIFTDESPSINEEKQKITKEHEEKKNKVSYDEQIKNYWNSLSTMSKIIQFILGPIAVVGAGIPILIMMIADILERY